jgi:hypothetical protein
MKLGCTFLSPPARGEPFVMAYYATSSGLLADESAMTSSPECIVGQMGGGIAVFIRISIRCTPPAHVFALFVSI